MRKIILPMLLIIALAIARPAVRTFSSRGLQVLRHNINQVEMCVSNFGRFGQNEDGSNTGTWWPKGSGHGYIFGAGSWFGTIEAATGDTLVTVGYNPHGGEAEYMPGIEGMSFSDPDAVIFMYPTNFPPPIDRYPMAPQSPKSHQDSWCAYNDLDATYHMPGDTRPIGLEVYQTVYAWNLSTTEDIIFIRYELKNVSGGDLNECYFGVMADNDIGGEGGGGNDWVSAILNHTYVIEGDTFQVDDLGYQWQLVVEPQAPGVPEWWPGTIGFDYLQSPYDLVLGMDKDNDSIPDQSEMDSAYYVENWPPYKWDVDGDGTPDWRDPSQIPQLGMSAFKRVTLDVEPNQDPLRYISMTGRDFRTGIYEPYDTICPAGDDQRLLQVSGPFELEDDEMVVVLVGIVFADWRPSENEYIFHSPDSALARVDATAQFIYDMNWLLPGPPPPPNLTCIPGDTRVTLFWDNVPEMTPDPYFDVVGNPANVNLYDPFYQQYDFEGYGIWKSQTGQSGTWEVLARYDAFNDITFSFPEEPDSTRLYATNTGLVHSYVDNDVRNGFTYYYAISAFDYNYVSGLFDSTWIDTFLLVIDSIIFHGDTADTFYNPDTLWDYDSIQVYGAVPLIFESGAVGFPASPRRDPANYVAPGVPLIEVLEGNQRLTELLSTEAISPFDIDPSRPTYLEFYAPETATILVTIANPDTSPGAPESLIVLIDGVRYNMSLLDVDNDTFTTSSRTYRMGMLLFPEELPVVDGIVTTVLMGTDSFPVTLSAIDTVVVTGSYPSERVRQAITTIPNPSGSPYCRGFWAYRGNNYQITWKQTDPPDGPVNTVEVLDLGTNEFVSFAPFQNDAATRHLGEGWCFTHNHDFLTTWTAAVSDTLRAGGSGGQRTQSLYINGCLIALYYTTSAQNIVDSIRPDPNDVWTVYATTEYMPTPVYGQIRISGTPGYFDTTGEYTLRVKVVPNPYIVANEWQQNFNQRRLKFINLPNQCTIRIFNLNGELIKTLIHSETQEMTTNQYLQNNAGGDEWWDLLSENRQLIASGLYIFHIQSNIGEQVGKFVVIR